jgi:arylsulfatase A-like enzyme
MDSTLVCFASDNGAYSLERYSELNKPLREGKGSLHEGGIRVPLIFRWPGRIKPGSTNASLVHFVDLLPTFAQIADATVPAGHKLDGKSLVSLMEGGSWSGRTFFTHFPHYLMHWGTTPGDVVVQDRWKLIHYPYDSATYPGDRKDLKTLQYAVGPRTELYDLEADPFEKADLAGQHPEKVAELMKQLDAWLKETGAKQPAINPNHDPARATFNQRTARE